jgi:hypothetical protein
MSPLKAPRVLRMDSKLTDRCRDEASSNAGHDVFSADEFSERDDAIGQQFRVLDQIDGVAS